MQSLVRCGRRGLNDVLVALANELSVGPLIGQLECSLLFMYLATAFMKNALVLCRATLAHKSAP